MSQNSTNSTSPISTIGQGGTAVALVRSLRISHWTKNVFVLAALPFSGHWSAGGVASAFGAMAAFCLLSSCVYLINDVADRKSDRLHPTKRTRGVASGRVSVGLAIAAAAGLLVLATALLTYIGSGLVRGGNEVYGITLGVWAGLYFVSNLMYSLWLKRRPIMDVLIIAMGFVLRAMAGAAAIAVVISPWMVVCTFTLCLFLALAKRRSEIAVLGEGARATRRVNNFYTLTNIEHMLAVSAGLAIVTYTLYCLAPRTIEHVGSANLVWTIPLVVYGMFRYYCVALNSDGQDVARLLMKDKVMWLVGLAWIVCVVVVTKWGAGALFRGILQ